MINLNLKPCPFCGHNLNTQDPLDTIYPVDREKTVYQIVCNEYSGGCDTTILGGSIVECINKWNRRIHNETGAE